MPYYDTMSEDLRRVHQILEDGKLKETEISDSVPPELRRHMMDASGTIYVKDLYAAYKLLESLSSELQKFYGLFSDHELPCESFEHAQAIWNGLVEKLRAHEAQMTRLSELAKHAFEEGKTG